MLFQSLMTKKNAFHAPRGEIFFEISILILTTIEFPLGFFFLCTYPNTASFSVHYLRRTHILLKRILGTPTYIGCLIIVAQNLVLEGFNDQHCK